MKYLEGLNPEQREAVEHFEGPILALAGAGSGKTRVLTTRIAYMIDHFGVDPSAILSVTFTNKAAGEMRNRIRNLLGKEPAGMWMGTFHSIGARLLRRHAGRLGWSPNFSIYDSDQQLREVKRAMERLNINVKKWHPEAVRSAISAAKNQLVQPDEYARLAADAFTLICADVYPAYQTALKEQNAFDFDDLLVKPVELFQQHEEVLLSYRRRFQFVLVDEYQDTNHAQYVFLEMLSREHGNLMVVGDDDQSIYGWRGADIRNILDFEKDFPNTRIVRLEQNYRSTGNILAAANAVISQNKKRKGKTLRTDAGPGDILTRVECLDERDEAEFVVNEIEQQFSNKLTPRDFVILYRTNSQSRAMEEALNRHAIPYQIIGGTRFYERREIMNVLAYLRLISNPRDAGAFDRIVNYPRRGIGDTSKATLLAWATERRLSPLEAALIAHECPALRGAAVTSLEKFATLIQRYTALAAHLKVGELVEKLIEEIGMLDALREEGPEGEDRMANVQELVAAAQAFEMDVDEEEVETELPPDSPLTSLDLYLQRVSLITDVDKHDPDANTVTLMTLHNAKGLEYPFVFITGLEDGLFPLARAYDEPEQLEEERRLFYVGITRAERKLYLTYARTRRRAGEVLACIPSSFLVPIPPHLIESTVTPALKRVRYQADMGWRERMPSRQTSRSSPRFVDDSPGTYIDYSDAQDAPRFVKGERVRHPQFGRGTIKGLSGFGMDLKAEIDFESVGRKKVVVRYANLQKEL
ncbi:MAG TPA: UvrD-helicase domain-containing protein [Longimicrobiales bacterium]|nr:UvrD-helicase domain-containing protein [Longimicrobiales bacterium]